MQQTQIDEIFDIVAQKATIERNLLTVDAKLAELNVTSLDMVEVIFALEDKLGIEMPFNANVNAGQFTTLGDVIKAVDVQLEAKKQHKAQ